MTLGDILGVLRDAYCRTVGVEYMHIQEPDQKRWIQEHVEGVSTQLGPRSSAASSAGSNAAEALEQFLDTKYIGQKRFGLEGGEAAIPLLDAVLDDAAVGRPGRRRCSAWPTGAGSTCSSTSWARATASCSRSSRATSIPARRRAPATSSTTRASPASSPGARGGRSTSCCRPTRLTSRRSTRWSRAWPGPGRTSWTESRASASHPVLPLLIHGDAAFAGQGVVAETLNMSALPGYETGGTVHLVINNQLGFTTNPESARSSVYATDVAKMVQAPIFHVNGDDPEACVRVGRLAFAFRQAFHKDVVIDMVCYRRFGHNEQDDPSLTQPLLYQLIKKHRSVRKLYTEALVRRGDITMDEAEEALQDFSRRLQAALDETRASAPPEPTRAAAAAGAGAGPAADRHRRAAGDPAAGRRRPAHASPTASPSTPSW